MATDSMDADTGVTIETVGPYVIVRLSQLTKFRNKKMEVVWTPKRARYIAKMLNLSADQLDPK